MIYNIFRVHRKCVFHTPQTTAALQFSGGGSVLSEPGWLLHPDPCTVSGPMHALISCCSSFPIRSNDLWNIFFHLCIHGFSRAGVIFLLLRGDPSDIVLLQHYQL